MIISERLLKWLLRIYPPMLFQRIWVISFGKGFKSVKVKLNRSLINLNYNKTIFGGTIYSAADPFYPLLFYQIFKRKKYNVLVWTKSAQITYFKPGRSDLYFTAQISDADIQEAERILNTEGKYQKFFPIELFDKDGDICASVMNEVYIRNLNFTEHQH